MTEYNLQGLDLTISVANMRTFVESHEWPKKLTDFPGIGDGTASSLAAAGYGTTNKLVARFLSENGNLEKCLEFGLNNFPTKYARPLVLIILFRLQKDFPIESPPKGWEAYFKK